jgi:hypothetical protein
MSLFVAVLTWGRVSQFNLRELTKPFGRDKSGNFTWRPEIVDGEFICSHSQWLLNIYNQNCCVQGAKEVFRNGPLSQFTLKADAKIYCANYSIRLIYNSSLFELCNLKQFLRPASEAIPALTFGLGLCSKRVLLPFRTWVTLGASPQADVILPSIGMPKGGSVEIYLTPNFLRFRSNSIKTSINGSISNYCGQAPIQVLNHLDFSNSGYRIAVSLGGADCCS